MVQIMSKKMLTLPWLGAQCWPNCFLREVRNLLQTCWIADIYSGWELWVQLVVTMYKLASWLSTNRTHQGVYGLFFWGRYYRCVLLTFNLDKDLQGSWAVHLRRKVLEAPYNLRIIGRSRLVTWAVLRLIRWVSWMKQCLNG